MNEAREAVVWCAWPGCDANRDADHGWRTLDTRVGRRHYCPNHALAAQQNADEIEVSRQRVSFSGVPENAWESLRAALAVGGEDEEAGVLDAIDEDNRFGLTPAEIEGAL